MPFQFIHICELLDALEKLHIREAPLLKKHLDEFSKKTVVNWLRHHKARLSEFGTNHAAVLSILRPHLVKDRIYGLDADSTQQVVARSLQLSQGEYTELGRWKKEPKLGDLGSCIYKVMEFRKEVCQAMMTVSPSVGNKVSVEEVDLALARLASYHPQSSEAVRSIALRYKRKDTDELLGALYCKLRPRECKWLTRIILKDLFPVVFPEDLGLDSNYSGLPNFLNVKIGLPESPKSPIILDGKMIFRGVVSNQAVHVELPKHPTSSAHAQTPIPFASSSQGSVTAGRATTIVCDFSMVEASHESRTKRSPVLRDTCQANRSPSRRPLAPLSNTRVQKSQSQSSQSLGFQRGLLVPSTPTSDMQAIKAPISQVSTILPLKAVLKVGTTQCLFVANSHRSCPLEGFIFILPPCLSATLEINDKWLPWHGATYTTSLTALVTGNLPRICSKTGKKLQKVILVDTFKSGPTSEFLKRVQALDIRTRVGRARKGKSEMAGDRERIEIYDWRILQYVAKADKGRIFDYDFWKRCHIMTI